MGLSAALRRFATARPHLLLLEEPAAGPSARWAVERYAREQGWPLVDTPADADVLVLTGAASGLAPFADRVWDQLPGPRARTQITAADDVAASLSRARAELLSTSAAHRAPAPESPPPDPSAGHDMRGHDMGGHDMGGHDMGGGGDPHAGHDMAGMELPAGLAMADRAPDRDGLMLDVLTVPWGPALPWWPAGLVLSTVVQGDVLQQVHVELMGDPAVRRAGWDGALAHLRPARSAAVVRLDAVTRLMAVLGWEGARVACQRVRDDLLGGDPVAGATPAAALSRLTRRVGGSRTLARMTSGVATSGGEDVTQWYRRWLQEAVNAVESGNPPPPHPGCDSGQLAALLSGVGVGAARMIVASVDLELGAAGSDRD